VKIFYCSGKGVIWMTDLLIRRRDERPSFQSYFAPSLISVAAIGCLGLLVSLGAAIYGLDLSAGLP
jgi:hypothetical protein